MQYYEDVEVGRTEEFGTYRMEREEMVAFAERFDPQPMHVDEEAARESVHGGLIASGLHTMAAATRLVVDGFLNDAANLGGLGIDDLRFHRPVRPGDELRVRHEFTAKRPSESNPDAGIVEREVAVRNQDDEQVASWETAILMARRT